MITGDYAVTAKAIGNFLEKIRHITHFVKVSAGR